jgi:hypothetical protein
MAYESGNLDELIKESGRDAGIIQYVLPHLRASHGRVSYHLSTFSDGRPAIKWAEFPEASIRIDKLKEANKKVTEDLEAAQASVVVIPECYR